MSKKSLLLQQLSRKLQPFEDFQSVVSPPAGWIKAIRNALGMSLQQLGARLSITKQSVQEIEQRERDGSITIRSLREVANALDMQLVYGFVPLDGSLEKLISRKAHELATQIVTRANNTMRLEDQENSKDRIQKAIQERSLTIVNELPKSLWN